jgi:arylsulfatase A-like enzyme
MASRRLIRVVLACLVVAAAAAWAQAAPAAEPGDDRPSILLVLTDDQRFDTLGVMPTVQRELVARGVTFTEAVAVNPLCCPSRATILTGQYSHTTRVYSNLPPYGGAQWFDDDSTIATWLHGAGYRTGYVGKYLNEYGGSWAPPGIDRWFTPPGWDVWLGYGGGYYGYSFMVDGLVGRATTALGDYSTDVFTHQAVAFVRDAGEDPFFLVYAPYAPHRPATPAARHAGTFASLGDARPSSWNEQDVSDKPAWVRSRARIGVGEAAKTDALRRRQLESLLAVDEGVDALVGALRASGRLENTLIVFASDNGFLWGEHRLPYRKSSPYEESVRIPLVVRWDRAVPGPRSDASVVGNVDLAPTFAAAAGVGAPGSEGASLLPLLRGSGAPWRKEILLEHLRGTEGYEREVPTYCGVRSPRWKYVAYQTREEELYDLRRDPLELVNLAGDPAHRAQLAHGRASVLRLCRPTPPGLELGWLVEP